MGEATVEMTEVKASAERRAAMEPDCYVLLPNGCYQGNVDSSDGETLWKRDEWGETNYALASHKQENMKLPDTKAAATAAAEAQAAKRFAVEKKHRLAEELLVAAAADAQAALDEAA